MRKKGLKLLGFVISSFAILSMGVVGVFAALSNNHTLPVGLTSVQFVAVGCKGSIEGSVTGITCTDTTKLTKLIYKDIEKDTAHQFDVSSNPNDKIYNLDPWNLGKDDVAELKISQGVPNDIVFRFDIVNLISDETQIVSEGNSSETKDVEMQVIISGLPALTAPKAQTANLTATNSNIVLRSVNYECYSTGGTIPATASSAASPADKPTSTQNGINLYDYAFNIPHSQSGALELTFAVYDILQDISLIEGGNINFKISMKRVLV